MPAELLLGREESVLTLTLSNPGARNAMHPDIYAAGISAIDAASRDAAVRAVVITGADNFFCAGGNLRRLLENREKDPAVQGESLEMLGRWISAIRACPKPVLAAVEGAAAGAGFSLALACDLIVAADDARFVMSYSQVGLSPDGGGSWSLSRAVPRALASELLFDAAPIDAPRLHALGVVNRIVGAGQALASALEWAHRLARRSPHALARVKALIEAAPARTLAEQLPLEKQSFLDTLFHADGLEGINAFLEKRKAVYP